MNPLIRCLKPLSAPAEFGFLYVATGRAYVEEAVISVGSLREHNPNAVVAAVLDPCEPADAAEFDCVFALEKSEGNSNDKITGIMHTPFPKTVFLDTDTRIFEPLSELEQMLERFDIAMSFDPIWESHPQPEIPEAFPTFNSGVIAFRRSAETSAFFERWLEEFRSQVLQPGESRRDQPPLRRVLYHSSLRFCALPPEYNLRVIYPYLVGGNARMKVVHGRHEYQERAMRRAGTVHCYPRVFGRNFGTKELGMMFLKQLWTRLLTRLGLRPEAKGRRVGVTGKF